MSSPVALVILHNLNWFCCLCFSIFLLADILASDHKIHLIEVATGFSLCLMSAAWSIYGLLKGFDVRTWQTGHLFLNQVNDTLILLGQCTIAGVGFTKLEVGARHPSSSNFSFVALGFVLLQAVTLFGIISISVSELLKRWLENVSDDIDAAEQAEPPPYSAFKEVSTSRPCGTATIHIFQHANRFFCGVAVCALMLFVFNTPGAKSTPPIFLIISLGLSIIGAATATHALYRCNDLTLLSTANLRFLLAGYSLLSLSLMIASAVSYRHLNNEVGLQNSWIIVASVGINALVMQGVSSIGVAYFVALDLRARRTGRINLSYDDEAQIANARTSLSDSLTWDRLATPSILLWPTENLETEDDAKIDTESELRSVIVWLCVATGVLLPLSEEPVALVLAPMLAPMILCLGMRLPEVADDCRRTRWLRITVGLADAGVAVASGVFLADQGFELSASTPANFGLVPICVFHCWLCLTTDTRAYPESDDAKLDTDRKLPAFMLV